MAKKKDAKLVEKKWAVKCRRADGKWFYTEHDTREKARASRARLPFYCRARVIRIEVREL